jgi:phosphotriesterase-related protein
MTAVVRTVLGDVAPDELGITYLHEHVILDSPLVADRMPEILLDDVEAAVAELAHCRQAGVGTMVDASPCAAGRDPIRLADVSRRTGIALVATTGLHTQRWYPGLSWANEAEPEVLAELFIADIVEGIDRFDYRGPVVRRSDHRAGLIKVGTLQAEPNDRDRRTFSAAAHAHRSTGAPVLTHCEAGAGGLEQVALLESLDVAPSRVVLSHTDKVVDPGYHRDLLATGVNLEYDQALRQAPDEERGTAWLLAEMVGEGRASQLMLGTDGARRSMWRSLGGAPGLDWLATGFTARLGELDVDRATVNQMMVTNPAAFLAFEPDRTT